MKKIATVLGLALGGLCLLSCDNKDKTVAELTGKILDMQTRLGALEAQKSRIDTLESMGQRVSALEAAEKRVSSLEKLSPRVSSLENMGNRMKALENLESRIVALETLPPRVRAVEGVTSRVAALETLPPRMSELDKLASRVAVLEERMRAQAHAAANAPAAKKELTPLQRTMALLEEYSIVTKTGEDVPTVFLGHVARVEHGDATMTDYPLLAEMLLLGDDDNPVPLSCVKSFVDAGADINAPTEKGGVTPLMAACLQADPAIVRYLLELGASAKAENEKGTALYYVLAEGSGSKRGEIARSLISAGCDVNKAFPNGNAPLMEAISNGADSELIEALLNLGADVTVPDESGSTVMDYLESEFMRKSMSARTRELLMEAWEKAHIKADAPAAN